MPETSGSPTSVCIVMPVFNGMAHLGAAVESLAAQEDPNWQLLAIDDASTDQSGRWLDVAAASDPRIRVKHQRRNRGLYGTLADAVDEINAEWVAVFMQDDRLRPDYLTEMRELISRHPSAEAAWPEQATIDGPGVVIDPGLDTAREEEIPAGVGPWRSGLRRGCVWTISGSLTRLNLLQRVRLRDDLPHCGDFDWFLRAVRCGQFVYYERPLIEIRRHPGQTSTANLRSGQDLQEALQVVSDQLRTHPADMSSVGVIHLAWSRFVGVLHRMAASAVHGRGAEAWRLSRHLLTCAALPWRAARARNRGNGPGRVTERL